MVHTYIHKNDNDQITENIFLVACENQTHHCLSHTDMQAPCSNDTYKIKQVIVISEIITLSILEIAINVTIRFLGSYKFCYQRL